MEALYAKLYDKYTKLKKKEISEFEAVNKEIEEKFLNFVAASEDLMEHLKSEKKDLLERVENMRTELDSIRSDRDDKCLENQNLNRNLKREEQKNKALTEEVLKLKEQIQEGHPRNFEDQSGKKQETVTPETARVTTRSMRKRSRLSEDVVEETDMISPHSSKHHKPKESLLVPQPQCCRTTHDGSSNSARCIFQALGEHLLGMELSTSNNGGEDVIHLLHPTTGLSFSLTFVKISSAEEPEWLYKVASLGTLQRVVPEWMREVIMFSTSMCPVFFERVSKVIKLY